VKVRKHRGLLLLVALTLMGSVLTRAPRAIALPPPTVSVGSASVVEARGTQALQIPVTLSFPASHAVFVSFTVSSGTAREGQDFEPVSDGTLEFPFDAPTQTSATVRYVTVFVRHDRKLENPETLNINLFNPIGAFLGVARGQGVILPPPPTSAKVQVDVGDIEMTRSGDGNDRYVFLSVSLVGRRSDDDVKVRVYVRGLTAPANQFVEVRTPSVTIPRGERQGFIGLRVLPPITGDTRPMIADVQLVGAVNATLGRDHGYVFLGYDPGALIPAPTPVENPTANPKSAPAPAPAPSGRVLFEDDFNDASLDLSKWQPNWLGGSDGSVTKPVNTAEQSCYDPSQVSVSGGSLHLRADNRRCVDDHGQSYSYASGLVNSRNHFTFTFGHVEARVWLPGGTSVSNWPAVWATGIGSWPTTGELDIMEGLAGDNCWHFHSDAGGPGGCSNVGTSSGWHTFAADWRPGRVTVSYDGKQVGQLAANITAAPMFLVLNLALSSKEAPPISTPSEMLVDYIRVTA
jgi:hypothetical protein